MKIGYYRQDGAGNEYIIPEEIIEEFEEDKNRIHEIEYFTDEWYGVLDNFSAKYDQYIVEGELYNMKIIRGE